MWFINTHATRQADKLKNYVTFSTKYTQALEEVSSQREKSSVSQFLDVCLLCNKGIAWELTEIIQQKAQADDPQNLRLADYLIKPIQRLCKYPLIFRVRIYPESSVKQRFVDLWQELLKSTPDDHKDRKFMEDTMSSLEALTKHVNECNQQAENEAKIQQIEAGLVGLDCVRFQSSYW